MSRPTKDGAARAKSRSYGSDSRDRSDVSASSRTGYCFSMAATRKSYTVSARTDAGVSDSRREACLTSCLNLPPTFKRLQLQLDFFQAFASKGERRKMAMMRTRGDVNVSCA